MPELKMAKDLEVWYSVALDKVHFASDYDAIKTLIERIDRAETALAAANERIAGLESDRIEARGIIAGLNDVISERTKPFVKIKKELADASS